MLENSDPQLPYKRETQRLSRGTLSPKLSGTVFLSSYDYKHCRSLKLRIHHKINDPQSTPPPVLTCGVSSADRQANHRTVTALTNQFHTDSLAWY
jgi:hypothetical protein